MQYVATYVSHLILLLLFADRVLVLDEVDQLDSKNQEVLYTMFEWPSLPKSRLVLIGMNVLLNKVDTST